MLQQKQQINFFHNHKNKCRCCFNEFTGSGTQISEWHRELFRLVIKVELRSDSRLSEKICSECNEKMKNLTEFTQTLSETQKQFCESVDNVDIDVSVEDEIGIEIIFQDERGESQNFTCNEKQVESKFMHQDKLSEPSKAMKLKQCFVRIEKLDETTLKNYKQLVHSRTLKTFKCLICKLKNFKSCASLQHHVETIHIHPLRCQVEERDSRSKTKTLVSDHSKVQKKIKYKKHISSLFSNIHDRTFYYFLL